MVEKIKNPQHIFIINIPVLINISQKLNLIDTLIEVILIVLNNFHAEVLLRFKIFNLLWFNFTYLNRLRKRRLAQIFEHLIAPRDNRVNHDRELLGFFKSSALSVVNHFQIETVVDDLIKVNRVKLILWIWVFKSLR